MGEAGFFALFFALGAVGVARFALAGFQAWLKSRAVSGSAVQPELIEDLRNEIHELIIQQDERYEELHSRLDFAERLLANPEGANHQFRDPLEAKEPTPV